MLTHQENELLCRVEGDAPMGQLMRRHWTPVCLIEEVSEPDGAPVKARVFGEDLVVFRDSEGSVGVLDEYCPHRRASLVYGRNEDSGLRCLYHGWKFDVSGNVLEMVSEPAASCMTDKVKHKAYTVQEWGGMVWAYMGPQDAIPEFVPPAWAPTSDTRVSIAKALLPCNWAQILEGAIDSAHSSSLHSSDFVPARVGGAEATAKNWLRPSTDKAPRLQVERTDYGFRYAALRRPIFNANTHDYVRSTVFVAPGTVLIPPNNLYNVANINVPMDDTNTAFLLHRLGRSGDDAGNGNVAQVPASAGRC
ncbi:phenylpropionate dioxygenase-like ring-hydroxylating dioxygenase large terminal subunit [Paraburkholderia sp. JPY419]